MSIDRERHLHDLMGFVGIRARPTAAGMLQLCSELHHAGVLENEALQRIKQAMLRELSLALPPTRSTKKLEETIRRHLDALFDPQGD